jgi:anthranilate synthase
VTAETDDGVVMAVEHTELPLEAVQFHPESIMTLGEEIGIRLIRNAVTNAMGSRATTVPAAHS